METHETPAGNDHVLDEGSLGVVLREEVGADLLGEAMEAVDGLIVQHDVAGEQAVAKGIAADAALARFGDRPAGFSSIAAGDFSAGEIWFVFVWGKTHHHHIVNHGGAEVSAKSGK